MYRVFIHFFALKNIIKFLSNHALSAFFDISKQLDNGCVIDEFVDIDGGDTKHKHVLREYR